MLARLFLLFTIVPVVELWLLISLGQAAGAVFPIALVVTTGVLGAWLARREGTRVLRDWQGSVQRGELPREGLTSSLLVLVGGILLVTPGVLTDVVGLSLLLPPSRRAIARLVSAQVQQRFALQAGGGIDPTAWVAARAGGRFIDVEASERSEAGSSPAGSSTPAPVLLPDDPQGAEPR